MPSETVCGMEEKQVPPLRYPEFLSRLVALAKFMRSSLTKTAHVDLSDVAKQEFGYAAVGMTNLLEVDLANLSTAQPGTILGIGLLRSNRTPAYFLQPPNEQICLRDGFEKQTLSAFIPSLTCRRQVSRS